MSGAPNPPVIPEPFAVDASDGNSPGQKTNPIPDTVTNPQFASWADGFQAVTMLPIGAGGKPPRGQDLNGILFTLSSHNYYVQAGQLFPYNSAVATVLGGYGFGCILGSTDTTANVIWWNTVPGNMTDPDSAGAAGWVALDSYGFLTLNTLTGGTVTLTPLQAARSTIVLGGTLTSNLTVVVPSVLKEWLIINNTSGAFNTTVRTAGGSGVTIPQGGFGNPTGVYGNGTNIYPSVSPLGVPIDQGPTPLTLVERTNAGNVNAQYFNQNSATNENPAVGAVFVQSTGNDGYLRKATLAYFESIMALSAIGGQVTAGQVPAAAVTQFSALLWASAALSGVPKAPTAALGTSTTQIATCAFANPDTALANPGHATQASGLSFRFGTITAPNVGGVPQDLAVVFDKPFNNVCLGVIPISMRSIASNGQAVDGSNFFSNPTVNGCTITVDAGAGGVTTAFYLAVGF